jgi:hypothetical protein
MAANVPGVYINIKCVGDRRGRIYSLARDPAAHKMTDTSVGYFPGSFSWGLGSVVAAVSVGAFIYGGKTWALSALLAGGAVAADFAFLIVLSLAWLNAGRWGGRGVILKGITGLIAKVVIPAGALSLMLWSGIVDVYPAVLGALAVATASPFILIVHFLRKERHTRLFRST